MWQALLWVAGIATAVVAIGAVVLIIKRQNLPKKAVLIPKYILIALAPLTWGIGTCVAESDPGREKASVIMMALLVLAAAAAFLGDIRRDI